MKNRFDFIYDIFLVFTLKWKKTLDTGCYFWKVLLVAQALDLAAASSDGSPSAEMIKMVL